MVAKSRTSTRMVVALLPRKRGLVTNSTPHSLRFPQNYRWIPCLNVTPFLRAPYATSTTTTTTVADSPDGRLESTQSILPSMPWEGGNDRTNWAISRIRTFVSSSLPKAPPNVRTGALDPSQRRLKMESPLDKVRISVQALLDRVRPLTPLPRVWESVTQLPSDQITIRNEIFQRTRLVVDIVHDHVMKKKEDFGGISKRKRYEDLVEDILRLCSEAIPSEDVSVLAECNKIMETMGPAWKARSRRTHHHHQYMILVAAREKKWREATELFWDNVDVQGSDHFVPFDVSHPFTLYAIGRDAQEKGNRVVETILDAAQRMNLLSPKHQDNCTWAVHLCETEQKLQGALEVLLDMQCYIRMRAHLLFFFL